MSEESKSSRSFLKIGMLCAIVVILVCLVFSLASGKETLATAFDFDPEIYVDPEKDAVSPDTVIKPTEGFSGKKPNIILIFTDDMGYGDLSCFGSKAIKTPNIDRLAQEGMQFTDFYASAAICSPSRAGLLTGRYPHRTGVTFPIVAGVDTFSRNMLRKVGLMFGTLGALDTHGGVNIAPGLPASEITVADALKIAGYQTACIGKWHIGDFTIDDTYLPTNRGFDFFTGFNGANDDWPVAFWRNETEVVKDIGIDQAHYTGLFTKEAIDFIERSKDDPFFLYLAHKDPHQPCIPSEDFVNISDGGRHGDTVEEVDWSVNEIMKCLKKNGLENDTLILFTSDNGPWYDGSPGNLRGRKGQSYEGGYRVPMIAWWPGKIPAGSVCTEPAMNFDFYPTFLRLAGLELPSDRIIDGKDIWGLLEGTAEKSPHDALYFFHHNELEGVRAGRWKYYRYINSHIWPIPLDKPHTFFGGIAASYQYKPEGQDITVPALGSWPLLYDMELDPGEGYNLMKKYPDIGKQMLEQMEQWEKEFIANPRGWVDKS